MDKKTKQLLLGIGAAMGAAALGGFYLYTAQKLIDTALNRKLPKAMERGSARIAGELPEFMKNIAEAGAALAAKPLETVTVTSHDGLLLVGHWHCPPNPRRVIVAMHGWRSNWAQDFGLIAPFWEENGCAVLYAEQRGQGNSGGEHMSFGLLERYDCLEWIRWAEQKTGGALPLYLGGISMGATTILMTAGFELPPCVKGIVADCGFTAPHAIWKHVVERNLHLPYGIYAAAAKSISQRKLKIPIHSYSCPEALKHCTVPVLFIHGTDDRFVPVSMTYENYKACEAPKRLLVIPGAGHGMSYPTDPDTYQKEVLRFWAENDGENP